MSEVEENLSDAAEKGRVEEVLSVLKDNPGLNVNWADRNGQWTALHSASFNGQVEVVKLLLAHPHINVNCKSSDGSTPVLLGCYNGQVSAVCVLLKDPRVNVTMADYDGRTPLWSASYEGKHEVVEWLMASGRDLGDITHIEGYKGTSALKLPETVRRQIVSLLERFLANPAQTRHEIRAKLGVLDELAAELFALTVFLCDDLLQLKPASVTTTTTATRFFAIATRLPMELQMILCHRAVGSMRQNVLHKDSEAGFKSLASLLS